MVLKPGSAVCGHEFGDGRVHFAKVFIGDGCTVEAYAAVGAGMILPAGTTVKGNAPEQNCAVVKSAAAADADVEDVATGDVSTKQTVLSEVRQSVYVHTNIGIS